MTILSIIEHDKKKVKIVKDEFSDLDLCSMRNGFQWSCFPVDDELLQMIKTAIDEYFGIIDNE